MSMRLAAALLLTLGAARADLSGTYFPLGMRCARALEAARRRAAIGWTGDGPELKLTQEGATAQFRVSDQCGVDGEGTLKLERDARPDAGWHRIVREDGPFASRTRWTRRHAGWRAIIEVVDEGLAPDEFEPAFRAAVNVCFGD
jgi:hypothetical protein